MTTTTREAEARQAAAFEAYTAAVAEYAATPTPTKAAARARKNAFQSYRKAVDATLAARKADAQEPRT